MRISWSRRGPKTSGAIPCPARSVATVEDCYACTLACEVGNTQLGARRGSEDAPIERLRARLSILVRPA